MGGLNLLVYVIEMSPTWDEHFESAQSIFEKPKLIVPRKVESVNCVDLSDESNEGAMSSIYIYAIKSNRTRVNVKTCQNFGRRRIQAENYLYVPMN